MLMVWEGVKRRVEKLEGATQILAVGHGWGKKLAQNNSKPHKAVIRLALMLWFYLASDLLKLSSSKRCRT